MLQGQATHRVVHVTLGPRTLLFWRQDKRRNTVYSGTLLDCERAMNALQAHNRAAGGRRNTYEIEPIDAPDPPSTQPS